MMIKDMIRVSKGQFFKQALLYCTKINADQLHFECFRGRYFSEIVQMIFAKYPFDTPIKIYEQHTNKKYPIERG